mgnify:CR=1 FL=1
MNRVHKLADRNVKINIKSNISKLSSNVPFYNLVGLKEIIAEAFDMGESTKKVGAEYERLIRQFGNELKILMEIPSNGLKGMTDAKIVEAIERVRERKLSIRPGYDGEYGEIKIFD